MESIRWSSKTSNSFFTFDFKTNDISFALWAERFAHFRNFQTALWHASDTLLKNIGVNLAHTVRRIHSKYCIFFEM